MWKARSWSDMESIAPPIDPNTVDAPAFEFPTPWTWASVV